MENNLAIQNADEYENRGQRAMAAVEAIQVTDDATNVKMGDVLAKIKLGMRTIEDQVNVPIKKADELHKWLTGIRAKILLPWKTAEKEAKERMANYQYKLMVAKREAERKQEEERRRLEEEQRRKAEAAIKANKPAKAEAILAKPVEPKTVVPEAPKTEKQTAVFSYTYEIVDANLIPDEFWVLDTTAIGARVRSEKLACKIPGIKVIEHASIRSY